MANITISQALGRGLRAALDSDQRHKTHRSRLGRSPSTARRFHALEWTLTGDLVVYDVSASEAGTAPTVEEIPDDTTWD
jgi:hypothetical protein